MVQYYNNLRSNARVSTKKMHITLIKKEKTFLSETIMKKWFRNSPLNHER